MRTKRDTRNPRNKRKPRKSRHQPSSRTLKSLKDLTYAELKDLSSKDLQKYKRRLHIIDHEHSDPYTDKDLIKKLRKYISKKNPVRRSKRLKTRKRKRKTKKK